MSGGSALTWHNWFGKESYAASCASFLGRLSQANFTDGEGEKGSGEQRTSSLYLLNSFTKAFDSQTQLYASVG